MKPCPGIAPTTNPTDKGNGTFKRQRPVYVKDDPPNLMPPPRLAVLPFNFHDTTHTPPPLKEKTIVTCRNEHVGRKPKAALAQKCAKKPRLLCPTKREPIDEARRRDWIINGGTEDSKIVHRRHAKNVTHEASPTQPVSTGRARGTTHRRARHAPRLNRLSVKPVTLRCTASRCPYPVTDALRSCVLRYSRH